MTINLHKVPVVPIGPAPKIAIRHLRMEFAGSRRAGDEAGRAAPGAVPVLEDVNLNVREGEFVCIVGPSGCGKSTLLNIVAGFLPATGGEVLVDGVPVSGPDTRRIYIFQEGGVFPWLTVEENVGFGLSHFPPAEQRRIREYYIRLVGLAGFERLYPRQLSGGMRQRAELARALAADPDVLYMDESFGSLDFLTRLRLRGELSRLWQHERKTVLFVTHDVEEAVQLGDRVVVLSRRPATIARVVEVPIKRPRLIDSPEHFELRNEIFAAMGYDFADFGAAEFGPRGRRAAGG